MQPDQTGGELESDLSAGSRKRSVWELLSSEEEDEPLEKEENEITVENKSTISASLPETPPKLTLLGPRAWEDMTQTALKHLDGDLKVQRRALSLWTACSGTGAPTIALEVSLGTRKVLVI